MIDRFSWETADESFPILHPTHMGGVASAKPTHMAGLAMMLPRVTLRLMIEVGRKYSCWLADAFLIR